jgi:hypothetical protein
MICGTVHSLASNARVRVAVSSAIGWQRAHPYHSAPSAWRSHVLTTPWEPIYPSSPRSDSQCEERIWILQS